MRILLNGNESDEIMEIIYAAYEDSAIIIKNDKQIKTSGLFFVSAEKDEWIISGISKYECDSICQKLIINGYIDASRYGEYSKIEYFE